MIRLFTSLAIATTPSALISAASNTSSASRAPLSYAPDPPNLYVPSTNNSTLTLLEFIKSRPELSTLLSTIKEPAGFEKAFETVPTWEFTFFAPSNDAFENIGSYFTTFAATPKGKWWLGNILVHHYSPNSILNSRAFNATLQRLQMASFLYVSAQDKDGSVVLNNIATVTEPDIPITSGVVHIIDHILDPSAQVFEMDLPKVPQTFIAGSCANPSLPFC